MFVTVAPGSLNLIQPPPGLLSKHPVLLLGIIRYFYLTHFAVHLHCRNHIFWELTLGEVSWTLNVVCVRLNAWTNDSVDTPENELQNLILWVDLICFILGTAHFCVGILKIRTMFGFRWVGGLREIGCSDFRRKNKYVHIKHVFSTKFFTLIVFDICQMIRCNRPLHLCIWKFLYYSGVWPRVYIFFLSLLFGFGGGWDVSSEIRTLFGFLQFVHKNGQSLRKGIKTRVKFSIFTM